MTRKTQQRKEINYETNGNIYYYTYSPNISGTMREDYYTDAEMLFGEHPIYDLISVVSFLVDVVPSAITALISGFWPPLGALLQTIELVRFLFFSASATDTLSSGVTSAIEEYTTLNLGNTAGEKMGWVNNVLGLISSIVNASSVFTPPTNDITVYRKIARQDFRAKFFVGSKELTMEEFISRCATS